MNNNVKILHINNGKFQINKIKDVQISLIVRVYYTFVHCMHAGSVYLVNSPL